MCDAEVGADGVVEGHVCGVVDPVDFLNGKYVFYVLVVVVVVENDGLLLVVSTIILEMVLTAL